MATIAKLIVELGLEDSTFQKGIENSREKLDRWGGSFRGWGTKLTAGVTTPLIGSGLMVLNWASDLEQAMGKSEAVFGNHSSTIEEWSKSTAKQYGFARSESIAMASTYGALFKVMGMSNDVAADYSMSLIGLSADMAAFNDVSNERASQALMSGLSGEYMSLRSMGVFLNEARVNEEALTIAMRDGREEITEADKVQARYNLIMEQTTQQQGQAAREANGWASSIARAKARAKDFGATIGLRLMPYGLKLIDFFERGIELLGKLSPRMQSMALIAAAVAAGIGPLLLIIGMLLPGLSALLAVIGFLVSPIGILVVAIAAIVAGLIYAYTHFEAFREIVNSVASAIQSGAIAAFEALLKTFSKLKGAFDAGGWSGLFAALGPMLLNGLQSLSDLAYQGIQWLADRFIAGVGVVSAAGYVWLQGLADGAQGKWGEFTSWLGGRADAAAAWIGDMTSMLLDKGGDLISGLWNGAITTWDSVITWISGRATAVADAIGDTTATLLQKGSDLLNGLLSGAVSTWETISIWVASIPSKAVDFVGDVTSTLLQKGLDLLQGLHNGAITTWDAISIWIASLPGKAVDFIGDVTTTLKQKGIDLLQGAWDGALDKWVAVSLWFTSLPTMIFNAIADTTETIKSRGTDLLSGFWNGALDKWVAVSFWFINLGTMIVAAIGDLSSSLWNAGVSIMNGLLDGLKSGWNTVTGWLSGLNPADWKGPEARDRKMLYKPGLWIMGGLSKSLDEGWGRITNQLASYVPELPAASFPVPKLAGAPASGTFSAASTMQSRGGGTTYVDNSTHTTEYVALTESDFQRLLSQSEKGADTHDSLRRGGGTRQYRRSVR